jgi:hypothetical protein
MAVQDRERRELIGREYTGMPNETDDDQRPPLRVEKMLNALDEVQEAVDRLATERRTTGRRVAHDPTLVEPFSRAERQTLKAPVPRT